MVWLHSSLRFITQIVFIRIVFIGQTEHVNGHCLCIELIHIIVSHFRFWIIVLRILKVIK